MPTLKCAYTLQFKNTFLHTKEFIARYYPSFICTANSFNFKENHIEIANTDLYVLENSENIKNVHLEDQDVHQNFVSWNFSLLKSMCTLNEFTE
jgi:hypothetical protein